MIIATGQFNEEPTYKATGVFTLKRLDNGDIQFETEPNFSFINGTPEPAFALFKGVPDASKPGDVQILDDTRFLEVEKSQSFPAQLRGILKNPVNIDDFDTVVLWCFAFHVPISMGPFDRV